MDGQTNEIDPLRESLCGRRLGDYYIERRVGGGATSDVFLAKQTSLGRLVALKVLKDELASDEKYVKRFLQEARAAARLEHPNIVRIYEVGELVDESDARSLGRKKGRRARVGGKTYRFIAQEYVGGMSLAQYLRRNGTTTIMQTFSALEQIASALKRASDENLVHRDVKPENVLIDSAGVLKVVDFGLAHFADSGETSLVTTALTRTGVALGTPLYMSPEQARGQKVDSRSDVYSLGITAYRMLTGSAPFYGETPLAVVLKHLNERPRPITEVRPEVPDALAKLVHRMLEKNPNDRQESMDVLLSELRAARRSYVAQLSSDGASSSVASKDAPTPRSDFSGVSKEGVFAAADLGEKASNEIQDVGESQAVGFFHTDDERDVFRQTLHTMNISRDWQTSVTKLNETRRASLRLWSVKSLSIVVGVLVLAFLLGGGALLLKNRSVSAKDSEPPLAIRRYNTVEEQYVCALQLGTVDAWKSVGEYFPDDEFWVSHSLRQLAFAYIEEKNVRGAESIFKEFVTRAPQELGLEQYGLIGLAWVSASDGDFTAALTTLSELNDNIPLDGLSEAALWRTQALFQKRYGENSALLDDFNRYMRRPNQPYGVRPNGFNPEGQGGPDVDIESGVEERRDFRGGGRATSERVRQDRPARSTSHPGV
ncbi:MAG: serine/threonine-protein kinase [Thermoguttaceae bacterium]|nr:serine/threonine-protein kinase [Thermoguttaceae bacterium]